MRWGAPLGRQCIAVSVKFEGFSTVAAGILLAPLARMTEGASLLDEPGFGVKLGGLDCGLPHTANAADERAAAFQPLLPGRELSSSFPSPAADMATSIPSPGFMLGCMAAGAAIAAVMFHESLLSLLR